MTPDVKVANEIRRNIKHLDDTDMSQYLVRTCNCE